MELGEKLKNARLEAGLSQRQLCEGIVTRNMLSLIENGAANPSMETLKLLAARMGKTMSFFLEETAVLSPNTAVLEAARQFYDSGAYPESARALEDYQTPDPVYDREKELLTVLTLLELAKGAIAEGRLPYARELLEKAAAPVAYCPEALSRRRLLLLGKTGEAVASRLPSLDEELILRAEEAFRSGNRERAAKLLDAAEDRTGADWNLLRGRGYLEEKDYHAAAQCLHRAETTYPQETVPLLEICYRELGDYKRAYEYACKGR